MTRFLKSLRWAAPFALAVLCITYTLWAAQLTTLMQSVFVNVYSNPDTAIATSWTNIDRDSLYKWIVQTDGTVDFAVKIQTRINGVNGDSITVDSANVTGGTERYIATVNGDSLMDAGWKQWTNYSATARSALKSVGTIQYRVIIRTYGATGTPQFSIYRYTE